MASFVDGQLPDDKTIINDLSKKSFEVESVETSSDGDSLFEIKVLPNRVADAMSIRGMALELGSVYSYKETNNIPLGDSSKYQLNNDFLVTDLGETSNPLNIFTGLSVKFDNSIETPGWIKEILEKSGGRSINCLVDITNMILFVFGQPAHVFDADKLKGKIVTRFAREGEELELLDGKKLKLDKTDFVIADEERALSLAGIKGGKLAEVDKNTKVGLFELANFNPTMIRKSSQKHGVRTDASKIFENGITTHKTEHAFKVLISTILDIDQNAVIEYIIDKKIHEVGPSVVEVKISDIENGAGKEISVEEIVKLLKVQNFEAVVDGEIVKVKASPERTDINQSADVVEEVLRLYGFDNIPSKPLDFPKNINHNTRFLLENFLKLKFIKHGFTEVFNYTFVDKAGAGSPDRVKVKLGIAADKEYLRNDLSEGAKNSFAKNYNYLPVLETDILRFFEIGMVFLDDNTEEKRCILVCDDNKKKTAYLETLQAILKEVEQELGIDPIHVINSSTKPASLEFSIDKIVLEIQEKGIKITYSEVDKELQSIKYKPLSVFPFIVRDIAMFVPASFQFEDFKKEIFGLTLSNLERIYKFDEFTKEIDGVSKTSIAFRIVFQSNEKTLTDVEVETEIQKVYTYLKEKNLEVR